MKMKEGLNLTECGSTVGLLLTLGKKMQKMLFISIVSDSFVEYSMHALLCGYFDAR